MPETCETCGRTYLDAQEYDEHKCVDVFDAVVNDGMCHEEVTRRGTAEPCNYTAVALRIDTEFGAAYPVCKRHVRTPMIPLDAIVSAMRQEVRS